MLDLTCLKQLRLRKAPWTHRVMGSIFLAANYRFGPGVQVCVEGAENLPSGGAILAMNHTDRYNYWPMQYYLYHTHQRFTATWVKGKYFKNPILGHLLQSSNNIPAVSRGYLIGQDFFDLLGRKPNAQEYRSLRSWIDMAAAKPDTDLQHPPKSIEGHTIPSAIASTSRNILGMHFDPKATTYPHAIQNLYVQMMAHFAEINRQALALNLFIIVFPQGTRSQRLSKGHSGLVQLAMATEAPVIPVGCAGSDKIYPGSSPWASSGEVCYRIGEAMHFTPADLKTDGSNPMDADGFSAFDPTIEHKHREGLQRCTQHMMQRIHALLPEEYGYASDGHAHSDGVVGSERFL